MDTANVVAALKEQRNRIDQANVALAGRVPRAVSAANRPGRHMSAEARKRISAAMKLRWAKWNGKSAPQKAKSRPPMSAAARKKLSVVDEGALGREAKVESIMETLSDVVRRLVYSRLSSLDLEPFEIRSLMLGNDLLFGSVAGE